jgi:DNA-binding CsgD family transcriptional regulator
METLSVILMSLFAFSGAGLWTILAILSARRGGGGVRAAFCLYSCLFAFVLATSFLLAAYQLKDIAFLMARRPATAAAFLDLASGVKSIARLAAIAILAVLASKGRPWPARIAVCLPLPIAGSIILLGYLSVFPALDSCAWGQIAGLFSIAAFWGYGLHFAKRGPSPERGQPTGLAETEFRLAARVALFAALPAKACLIAADALVPGGIDPMVFALPEFLFLLFLNARGFLSLARRSSARPGLSRTAGPGDLSASGLSAREAEVASYLAEGRAYKEISRALSISIDTVKSHAKAVYRKTKTANRGQLMRRFGPSGDRLTPISPLERPGITPSGDSPAGGPGPKLAAEETRK